MAGRLSMLLFSQLQLLRIFDRAGLGVGCVFGFTCLLYWIYVVLCMQATFLPTKWQAQNSILVAPHRTAGQQPETVIPAVNKANEMEMKMAAVAVRLVACMCVCVSMSMFICECARVVFSAYSLCQRFLGLLPQSFGARNRGEKQLILLRCQHIMLFDRDFSICMNMNNSY